jgi:hypothetical protein
MIVLIYNSQCKFTFLFNFNDSIISVSEQLIIVTTFLFPSIFELIIESNSLVLFGIIPPNV